MVAICLLIGILDGLGLTMFLPLLQIADGSLQGVPEGMGKIAVIFELVDAAGITLTLTIILIFLCVFFVSKGFLNLIP